jgi:putative hydrolase of the HAD superfamily
VAGAVNRGNIITMAESFSTTCENRREISTVFFDVGGTLIEPRHPVGEIYADYAASFGMAADPHRLQENFARLFPQQPRLAFAPGLSEPEILAGEKGWWRQLVSQVLATEGVFPRFDEFFDAVYHGFEGRGLWQLIEGVAPVLEALRQRGFRLGVVSNFDSRLFKILRECELDHYFDVVLISSRCGSAKPETAIFQFALEALDVAASAAVHVGDSWREDAEGAQAAGMRAILLDRQNRFNDNLASGPPGVERIVRFDQLLECDYLRRSGQSR